MSAQPETPARASERGHWYWPDGRPAYEVPGAKPGTWVKPDSRHTRKFGLLKSVTTIIRDNLPKPGLEVWKFRQGILAALTLPRNEGESDDAFIARIEEDSKAYAKKRAEEGIAVHEAIANYVQGKPVDEKYLEHARLVADELSKFYCGLVDFKTKDTLRNKQGKPKADKELFYAEHIIQLAAYQHGLQGNLATPAVDGWNFETSFAYGGFGGRVDCYRGLLLAFDHPLVSIMVGMQPAEVRVHVWSREDVEWGWLRFRQLLAADSDSDYRLNFGDKP